jgi:hypothetical protein
MIHLTGRLPDDRGRVSQSGELRSAGAHQYKGRVAVRWRLLPTKGDHGMNTAAPNSMSTLLRSLQVFLLATIGLAVYLTGFALVVLALGMIVSAWAHAQDVATPPPIDAGISGSWYDPDQSGHGLMLEVLSDNRLLALWFAFDPNGNQAWFGGLGTYSGNVATLTDIVQPIDGRWVPDFDPNAVVRKPWGTLTFTFTDHDHGRVDFDSVVPGFGAGTMNLLRLTRLQPQAAANMPIGAPVGVTAGADGKVYFSAEPNRIYRVDANGTLTLVAGGGAPGYSGDGGPATQAQLNFPFAYPEYVVDPYDYGPMIAGLARDGAGNVYFADAYNNRVRKIDTNGIITTVAGNGARLNSGDGGPATQASVYWPQGVGVAPDGSVYVTSVWGPVRKIGTDGTITRLANANCGSSYLGPGFCVPEAIAVDTRNGSILVPDGYCRVRRLVPGVSVTTVAGADRRPSNGFQFTCGYDGDGGPATNAALNYPYAVATRSNGEFYIADTYNDCVRRVDNDGIITTFAGKCGLSGFGGDGGPATAARMRKPFGIAVDNAGNVYVAEWGNKRIRKIATDGTISTFAGNGDDPDPSTITPAFSGNWYNPNQSGHGLMIEVLPQDRMLAVWFAFDSAGRQSWFGGVGTYRENSARITDVALPTGGYWIPNFDPAAINRQPWGALTLRFDDCSHGSVQFESLLPGYGSGSLDLLRLTQPLGTSCP